MVVCQYYLNGYCRFGNRCRNEHIEADNDYRYQQNYSARQQLDFGNETRNRFALLSTPSAGAKSTAATNVQNIHDMTTDEIIAVISQEVESWESSHMWPFSCFAFCREVCSMPGLDDISVEEVHFKAYEAQAHSNVESYTQWLAELKSQYSNIKEQLKRPNSQTRMKLTEFINEVKSAQTASSTSSSTTTFGAHNQFASTAAPSSSVFGGSNSASSTGPFGGFGTGSGSSAVQQAIVGGLFRGPTAFGGTSTTPQSNQPNSTFDTTAVQRARSTGLFGSGGGGTRVFGSQSAAELRAPADAASSLFGSKSATGNFTSQSTGLFGKGATIQPASCFNTPQTGSVTDKESSQFTKLCELTPAEKTAFEAATFTLGLVPTRPPPREMV